MATFVAVKKHELQSSNVRRASSNTCIVHEHRSQTSSTEFRTDTKKEPSKKHPSIQSSRNKAQCISTHMLSSPSLHYTKTLQAKLDSAIRQLDNDDMSVITVQTTDLPLSERIEVAAQLVNQSNRDSRYAYSKLTSVKLDPDIAKEMYLKQIPKVAKQVSPAWLRAKRQREAAAAAKLREEEEQNRLEAEQLAALRKPVDQCTQTMPTVVPLFGVISPMEHDETTAISSTMHNDMMKVHLNMERVEGAAEDNDEHYFLDLSQYLLHKVTHPDLSTEQHDGRNGGDLVCCNVKAAGQTYQHGSSSSGSRSGGNIISRSNQTNSYSFLRTQKDWSYDADEGGSNKTGAVQTSVGPSSRSETPFQFDPTAFSLDEETRRVSAALVVANGGSGGSSSFIAGNTTGDSLSKEYIASLLQYP